MIKRGSRKAKLKFTSSEPGSTFSCKIDRKRLKSCSSPQVYKRLRRGKHKFKVGATDSAGNADRTLDVQKFKIKR